MRGGHCREQVSPANMLCVDCLPPLPPQWSFQLYLLRPQASLDLRLASHIKDLLWVRLGGPLYRAHSQDPAGPCPDDLTSGNQVLPCSISVSDSVAVGISAPFSPLNHCWVRERFRLIRKGRRFPNERGKSKHFKIKRRFQMLFSLTLKVLEPRLVTEDGSSKLCVAG